MKNHESLFAWGTIQKIVKMASFYAGSFSFFVFSIDINDLRAENAENFYHKFGNNQSALPKM
jgi:hypothetical protein